MAAKRFTYWTDDGKRHWTPRINITLDLSESAKFGPADKRYDCRMHKEPFAALPAKSVTRPATVRQR